MKTESVLCYVLILLTVSPCLNASEDGTFTNVNLYSRERSIFPRMAVDPASGTVLIIWSNEDVSNRNSRGVLKALISIKKDGSWKLNKARRIVSGGTNAAIAFNNFGEDFLIVWDTKPPLDYQASKIKGQLFNLKGRKSSGIISYDDLGLVNLFPNVVYNKNDNNFLLVWMRSSLWHYQDSSCGLMSAILDANGEQSSQTKKIRELTCFENYVYYDVALCGTFNSKSNRSIFVVVEEDPVSTSKYYERYFIYKFDRNGNLFGRDCLTPVALESDRCSYYASISEQNKSNKAFHFIAWAGNGRLTVRELTRKGKLKGLNMGIGGLNEPLSTAIAYSAEYDLYFLINDGGNGLKGRFLNTSGEIVGGLHIISKNKESFAPAVAWNPVLGEFLVVWAEIKPSGSRTLKLSSLPPPTK